MVYLDFNASAPMVEGVEEAVAGTLGMVGNPSSVHGEGRAARKIVEEARDDVAALVGAKPENVIFTSGATEANNLALLGAGRKHVIVSATEHVSVLAHAPAANHLSVDGDGVIDLDQLPEFLKRRGRNSIVSIMAANNETGVIQPVGVAARRCKRSGESRST
jgi:cysteine desulfurase